MNFTKYIRKIIRVSPMHANRLWRLLFVLSRRLLNVFKISTEPFRKGRRGEKIFEGHPYGFLGRPVTATRFRPEPSVNRSEWLTPDYRRRGEKNGNREGRQSGFVRKIKLQTNRRKSVSGGLFSFTLLNAQPYTISLRPRRSRTTVLQVSGKTGRRGGVGESKKQKMNKGR